MKYLSILQNQIIIFRKYRVVSNGRVDIFENGKRVDRSMWKTETDSSRFLLWSFISLLTFLGNSIMLILCESWKLVGVHAIFLSFSKVIFYFSHFIAFHFGFSMNFLLSSFFSLLFMHKTRMTMKVLNCCSCKVLRR